MNYFNLLNLEQKYDLDLKELNKRYLEAQLKFHPDKARDSAEKNLFLQASSNINKAYQILKDEVHRAEYILLINAINITEKKDLPQNQLIKIWEELEVVEKATKLSELAELYAEKNTAKHKLMEKLTDAFNNHNLQDALDITISLKYLTNLINNIKIKQNATSGNQ